MQHNNFGCKYSNFRFTLPKSSNRSNGAVPEKPKCFWTRSTLKKRKRRFEKWLPASLVVVQEMYRHRVQPLLRSGKSIEIWCSAPCNSRTEILCWNFVCWFVKITLEWKLAERESGNTSGTQSKMLLLLVGENLKVEYLHPKLLCCKICSILVHFVANGYLRVHSPNNVVKYPHLDPKLCKYVNSRIFVPESGESRPLAPAKHTWQTNNSEPSLLQFVS